MFLNGPAFAASVAYRERQQETRMSAELPATTRISDLIHALTDPVEYINGVAANFVSYGYDPETCVIRHGIKGAGIAPNYRIEEPSVPITINVCGTTITMTATPAHTFNGRNHREMVELDDLEWHDENWSAKTTTFGELKALLSKLSQSRSIH
jgi:hypothetical protein